MFTTWESSASPAEHLKTPGSNLVQTHAGSEEAEAHTDLQKLRWNLCLPVPGTAPSLTSLPAALGSMCTEGSHTLGSTHAQVSLTFSTPHGSVTPGPRLKTSWAWVVRLISIYSIIRWSKARWQRRTAKARVGEHVSFSQAAQTEHAHLFPATSRTWSSVACDTSAGIRVSLLSRMQNTVRLQHPPICNRKENTTCFQIDFFLGGGRGMVVGLFIKWHEKDA